MHFTGNISLGNVLVVVTLVGTAVQFGMRLGTLETTLRQHADALMDHANRLEQHDSRLLDAVGNIQRMLGRLEVKPISG